MQIQHVLGFIISMVLTAYGKQGSQKQGMQLRTNEGEDTPDLAHSARAFLALSFISKSIMFLESRQLFDLKRLNFSSHTNNLYKEVCSVESAKFGRTKRFPGDYLDWYQYLITMRVNRVWV